MDTAIAGNALCQDPPAVGMSSAIEIVEHLTRIVEAIIGWAKMHQDIRGVALVGSHARGTARLNSDIDLEVLTVSPEAFRADGSWVGFGLGHLASGKLAPIYQRCSQIVNVLI